MSVSLSVPPFSRYFLHRESEFVVEAKTLRQAIEEVGAQHPDIPDRWFRAIKELRGAIIFINKEDVRYKQKLDTPLNDGDEIVVLFAIPDG